jgi:hypothetical protein
MKVPETIDSLRSQTWFKVMAGGTAVSAGMVGMVYGLDLGPRSTNATVSGVDLSAERPDCDDIELNIEGEILSTPVRLMLLDRLDDGDDCDDLLAMDNRDQSGPARTFRADASTISYDSSDASRPDGTGDSNASFSVDSPDSSALAGGGAQGGSVDSPDDSPSFDSPDNSASFDSPDDSPMVRATPSAMGSVDASDDSVSFDSPDDSLESHAAPASQWQPQPAGSPDDSFSFDSPDDSDSFDSPDNS